MRIALERADLRALRFASSENPPRYQVSVREGQGVRGELSQDPAELVVRALAAEKLVLDALRLMFGTLLIESPQEALFEELRGDLLSRLAALELSLTAHAVRADPLAIHIGEVKLGANTHMQGVVLRVGKDGGSITVEQLVLRDFQVLLARGTARFDGGAAGFSGQSAELSAQGFALGWGVELRVSAARIAVPELVLGYADKVRLTLTDLTCTDLAVRGPHVLLGGLHVKRAKLRQQLTSTSAEGAASAQPEAAAGVPPAVRSEPATPQRKAVALDLLDGLSGQLQVDVQVDITIPIFGTRRAKHELRLSVEGGSVDYRELESNLAPLENSLLDFSLRGSELVLERGIPLLPTRGFGKPILRWPLSQRDRELAERDRVRLALLPAYELAKSSRDERDEEDDEEDESRSRFALRKLGLNILDFSLSLAPVAVPNIALRGVSIERLSVRGSIQHHLADVDPEGVVTGDMRGLMLSIDGLGVGTRALSLQKLQVLRIPRWVMRFSGLTPTALELDLEDIMLIQLSLRD